MTSTHANRMLLDVSGSVADMEKAFHVTLRTYRHPDGKRGLFRAGHGTSVDLACRCCTSAGWTITRCPGRFTQIRWLPKWTPGIRFGASGSYMGYDFRNAYVPGTS